jgi:2-methylisocitrate lyase-like PEP mutase family enzyme
MARRLPVPFTFVARAENLIRGRPDLDDTIKRLQAFEKAGADVLYAPGLRDLETMRSASMEALTVEGQADVLQQPSRAMPYAKRSRARVASLAAGRAGGNNGRARQNRLKSRNGARCRGRRSRHSDRR